MNMGRAMCTAIGTVTWVHTQIFSFFIFISFYFEKHKWLWIWNAPSTGIQPGRKERRHIRHKHKQDTGNSHVHTYIHTCTCTYIHIHGRENIRAATVRSESRAKMKRCPCVCQLQTVREWEKVCLAACLQQWRKQESKKVCFEDDDPCMSARLGSATPNPDAKTAHQRRSWNGADKQQSQARRNACVRGGAEQVASV